MRPRSTSRLIYDSARSRAIVGRRSATFEHRTLVFSGGTISLDVVVHSGSRGGGYVLGQVIDAVSNRPVARANVHLRGHESPVRTDELGEFAMPIEDEEGPLRLEVETGPVRMHCVVPPVTSYGRHGNW